VNARAWLSQAIALLKASTPELTRLVVSEGEDPDLLRTLRTLRQATAAQVTQRSFSSHSCIKTMIQPRQARDKHRETTQKRTVLLQHNAA
jgi:hypothetical protein